MRRLIVVLVAVGAALLVTAGAVHAQTPMLSVVPGSANQFQSLTVTGEDFTPGAVLRVTFIAPGNEEILYVSGNGPASVVVEPDGRFTLSIVPAVDFAGARAGRWLVSVCTSDGSGCWEAAFTVVP
jgi:hypothetical protein